MASGKSMKKAEEVFHQVHQSFSSPHKKRIIAHALDEARNEAIEECAGVADNHAKHTDIGYIGAVSNEIANAIRKLKEVQDGQKG